MARLAHWLDAGLVPLFIVTAVLLAIGCALTAVMRGPAHRQRTAELTLSAVFICWILACLPLPRFLPEQVWTVGYLRAAAPGHKPTPASEENSSVPPASLEVGELQAALLRPLRGDDVSPDMEQTGPRDQSSTSTALLDEGQAAGELELNVPFSVGRREADAPWAHLPAATVSRITIVYLGGAVACTLWLAGGRLRLARMRRAARQPPAWLAEMFKGLCQQAGQQPRLLVSRHCSRPISWGVWRPTIVLPLALARRRHREQLRMVLLHELAHVVRRDARGNALVCLGFPLLYPHPTFWWLRAQVRLAAELLADDWAAQRGGKLAYVAQLVSVARSSRNMSPDQNLWPLAGAVTLYSSSSQFYRRMQMLISRTCPLSVVPSARWRAGSLGVTALIAVTAASLAGVRPAAGQQATGSGDAVVAPAATEAARAKATEKPAAPPSADSPKAAVPDQPLNQIPSAGALFDVVQAPAADRATADEQALRARLAAAEERVRLLEAELKLKAGAKPKVPATGSSELLPRQADAVTLTRVAEDGSITHEIWTTDADGRLDKLVSKAAGRPGESLIKAAKTSVLPDGRIVKQFTDKKGTVMTRVYDPNGGHVIETEAGTTNVYDPKTGRLIVTRSVMDLAATKSAEGAEQPKTAGIAVREKPHAQPLGLSHRAPTSETAGAETAGLDLVNLATSYADAVGAVEEAEAKVAEIESSPSNHGLAPAKAALRGARRKQELLRNLASVGADAARTDLERVQQLVRVGVVSAESAAAAESRWKMLRTILESGGSSPQGGSADDPLRSKPAP
jgi:beta-lactamase regulating signal transducer with metallopeptidase domain